MAQVVITFAKVDNTRGLPAYSAYGARSEEVTTSGTAAATTITADEGDYARVVNNGTGLVWVTFGASPTAAVATGGSNMHPMGANTTMDFGPLAAGHKASVIDDS